VEQGICVEDDCDAPAATRALCLQHYGMRYRSRDLPDTRTLRRHQLSNVDPKALEGDCSACGHGVKLRLQIRNGRETIRCAVRTFRRRGKKVTPEQRRASRIRRKYGIAYEEYLLRLSAQGGRCLLCKSPGDLCVDHDHATGRVRGLLCRSCNLALGYLRDDVTVLRRAIKYLATPAR